MASLAEFEAQAAGPCPSGVLEAELAQAGEGRQRRLRRRRLRGRGARPSAQPAALRRHLQRSRIGGRWKRRSYPVTGRGSTQRNPSVTSTRTKNFSVTSVWRFRKQKITSTILRTPLSRESGTSTPVNEESRPNASAAAVNTAVPRTASPASAAKEAEARGLIISGVPYRRRTAGGT
jgi:hypothetical protein